MSGTPTNPLTGLPIDDNDLSTLSTLVEKQAKLEAEIKEQEEKLKALKTNHLRLSTELIPDKLNELGLSSLTTNSGRKVVVKPFYSAKVLCSAAYSWLDEHGHGGIIKTTVERKFSREEREQAVEFAQQNEGFVLSESIHHQTLGAFVKEIYSDSENEPLPEGLFSVYQGSRTKIS